MTSIGLVGLLREQGKQLEQERDELNGKVTRLSALLEAEPFRNERIEQIEQERDTLAAQNEGMREAIELYFKQYPHMMKGYILDAINSPNLAAEVLKRRDATVESKLLRGLVSGANGGEDGWVTCKDLLDMAAEIEKETDR